MILTWLVGGGGGGGVWSHVLCKHRVYSCYIMLSLYTCYAIFNHVNILRRVVVIYSSMLRHYGYVTLLHYIILSVLT